MSHPSSDDIVILVTAAEPELHGIVDVLRDWVAADLVQPFLWLQAQEIDSRMPLAEVVATSITGRAARRVRLQDHLADRRRLGLVRLVPLDLMGDPAAAVPYPVASFLHTSLGGVRAGRISPVRCLVARHGRTGRRTEPAWTGWHTIVLAPEDAWSPAASATDLTYAHSDAEFNAHAAAVLAGVTGLWSEVHVGPLDEALPGTLTQPVVARAFIRRLDATSATAALRRALTDVSAGLPLPHHSTSTCQPFRRPDGAVAKMVQAVMARNEALFAVQRVAGDPGPPAKIGAIQALRMFFDYLTAAVRRAPWAAINSARTRLSIELGRRLQATLFGEDESRFQVIVAGVDATGLIVGADEVAQETEEIARLLKAAAPDTEQPILDAAPFWKDVANGALSLADGGERTAELAPERVGGLPGVVTDTGFIAADPDSAFTVPLTLASAMHVEEVAPYDVLAQDQLSAYLRERAGSDLDTARIATRLDAWRREVDRAYTTQIGHRLGEHLNARRAALAQIIQELRDTAGAGVGNERPTRGQQFDALRALIAVVVGVGVIAVGAWFVDEHDWLRTRYVLGVAVIAAILWTAWLTAVLVRHQRRIFQVLHAQNAGLRRRAAAVENIGHAVAELHVAAVLYRQYLAWAAVLGRFVRQPFGPVPEAGATMRLGGPMPRAMGIGMVRHDPEKLRTLVHQVSASIFECGWMSELWLDLLREASRHPSVSRLLRRADPLQALYADEAAGPQSLLQAWSAAVVSEGLSGTAGDTLWLRGRAQLAALDPQTLADGLFADIELAGQDEHGVVGGVDGAAFLTQAADSLADPGARHFSMSLFEPAAVSQEAHRVAETVVIGTVRSDARRIRDDKTVRWLALPANAEAGLNQFMLIVQLTAPLPADQLRLSASASSLVEPTVEAPEPSGDLDPSFPRFGI